MNELTVGSLFSGIGGFDLGLERAGMRVVWQCEQDPYCRAVLAKHWPGVPCYPDVRELREVERVDVLCGGFPCQDLSLAGKGAGIDGQRSGLWGEYARLVRELRPRYVLVENVAALLGRGLGRVLGDLAACGYDAEWDCVPASAVGAPHRRDRLWIVAYPNEEGGAVADAEGEPVGAGLRARQPGGVGRGRPGNGGSPGEVWDTDVDEQGLGWGERLAGSTEGGRHIHQWAVEPDVRLLADGLSEGVGVDASDQDRPVANPGGTPEELLRGVWRHVAARAAPHGRRPDEQLARELADALSVVSHPLALGERKGTLEAARSYVRGVRQALEALGAVSYASEPTAPAWVALSAEDQAWVDLAVVGGQWAAEWPGVGRVSTGERNRVDRLAALGNALVPQIAEWLGKRIIETEEKGP